MVILRSWRAAAPVPGFIIKEHREPVSVCRMTCERVRTPALNRKKRSRAPQLSSVTANWARVVPLL